MKHTVKWYKLLFMYLVSVFFISGCFNEKMSFEFAFESELTKDIYVENLDGFDSKIGCGFIGKNKGKSYILTYKGIPKECYINWNFETENSSKPSYFLKTKIDLTKISEKNLKGLKFTLIDNNMWKVVGLY